MSQQLLMPSDAALAKDRAIAQVHAGNKEFIEEAYAVLLDVASRHTEISSLTVWEAYGGAKPKHPRAMGPVFMRAYRKGIIQPTDKWVKSGRITDHNQDLRIWKSLLV